MAILYGYTGSSLYCLQLPGFYTSTLPLTHIYFCSVCVPEKPWSRYTIRLHTTIPEAPFKPAKLVPDRNNLRLHALEQLPPSLRSLGNSSDKELSSMEATDLSPTPHYNRFFISGQYIHVCLHLASFHKLQCFPQTVG